MGTDQMLTMLYETLFGVLALFILTKILGKTQISQLTAFDFIAAVVLGELVGNALFDKEAGILEIGYVILLWGIILYAIEMIAQKFKGSRFILEGKPSLVIHEGNIIYEEMRKNRIDINELQQMLRMKDVFALQEVEYAVLETNGELSVLKKAEYQSPTKKDLNVVPTESHIAITVITDGEMIKDNLKEAGISEQLLLEELNHQNFTDVKDVFYAEFLKGKKLFVLPYTKIKKKHLENKIS
ncbi:DUF421 domain-containing protein [Pseudogracilibacillus sp. SE30717A]|uniref:DUF421 domain-containing protein n=1 Tax=Pseudogracilibacillus sp. SE30717A TaxID=3098293 RepID=UPI00300DF5BC